MSGNDIEIALRLPRPSIAVARDGYAGRAAGARGGRGWTDYDHNRRGGGASVLIARGGTMRIGRRAWSSRGPAAAADGLLLVGHGSYCGVSEHQMQAVGDLVAAALPEIQVDVGFLEMTEPPAGVALDRLIERGVRRLAVLPLMLLAAGHGKSDVPAVVVEARRRHPGVEVRYGRPFGVHHRLVTIAADNIVRAGGAGLPLVVSARGTSDPDANGDALKAGRLLAEFGGHPWVVGGFSGVTWPVVPEALQQCRLLGAEAICAFAWFLCNGKLVERMRDDYAAFTSATGLPIVDAGYFGPDARLAAIIVERYAESLGVEVAMNCDVCAYRLPYPGLEHRVGQPIGVGHSHLAVEHRAHIQAR